MTTNPPFVGVVAVAMRCLLGIPYVIIVHDVYPDAAVRLGLLRSPSAIEWLWNIVTRQIFQNASSIIVIGRDMDKLVRTKLRRNSHTVVIPNWSDEARVFPVSRVDNSFICENGLRDNVVVQYAGNMGRTHNLEVLLGSAELLADRKEIVFQFIGDGVKQRSLKSVASERGLANVRFLPYQPYERLSEMLSAAHLAVVVLDKGFEGISVPSKTYSIMAAAVPILGLLDSQSEIGRTICENRCGVVLENATAQSVAEVIRHLSEHPADMAEMGTNGRRAFLAQYSLSRALDRYEETLQQVFGSRSQTGLSKSRDVRQANIRDN